MWKMRSTWTDSRLDDLNGHVGDVRVELRHQSDRIDSLQSTILLVGGSLIAAVLGLMAAMLGILVTQL